ncbi:hypothetical protein SAMN04487981_11421 [Streptomyces sp. cf386]|uniref:hypothetical protein n=1 Tax=Streptomyces sp. cf386 TaxID=1761904 RepID=UPI0008832DDE|nr:hypothetical protein [Streptomyces sp. cf386]SDO86679.1 hypothetical protein SAMN04487981_11421 [Streptomyces sp. cf386]
MNEVTASRADRSARRAGGVAVLLRLLALLVLVAGTAGGMSYLIPDRVGVTELTRDADPDGSLVVHVRQTGLLEVRARWSTGFLGDKEIVHHFDMLPSAPGGVAAFEKSVKRALDAEGRSVDFVEDDPLRDLGGLSAFVPVLYWRFIPGTWLPWSVLLCAVAVLASIARGGHRRAAAGHWYAACLLAGTGFLVHLWSEPAPLGRPGAAGAPPMSGRQVATRTLAVLAAVVLSGFGLAALRGY